MFRMGVSVYCAGRTAVIVFGASIPQVSLRGFREAVKNHCSAQGPHRQICGKIGPHPLFFARFNSVCGIVFAVVLESHRSRLTVVGGPAAIHGHVALGMALSVEVVCSTVDERKHGTQRVGKKRAKKVVGRCGPRESTKFCEFPAIDFCPIPEPPLRSGH